MALKRRRSVGDGGMMNTVSRVGGHSRLFFIVLGRHNWDKQDHRLVKLQLDDDV